jgi:hypothetical protein
MMINLRLANAHKYSPSRAEIPDQVRYDGQWTYPYATHGSNNEKAKRIKNQVRHDDNDDGRANYKMGYHTRIGDSSLYARNDEEGNATDKKMDVLTYKKKEMVTERDASASSATQDGITMKKDNHTCIGDSSLYARNDEYNGRANL